MMSDVEDRYKRRRRFYSLQRTVRMDKKAVKYFNKMVRCYRLIENTEEERPKKAAIITLTAIHLMGEGEVVDMASWKKAEALLKAYHKLPETEGEK